MPVSFADRRDTSENRQREMDACEYEEVLVDSRLNWIGHQEKK
jgi:hypothetical protein